MRKLGLMGGGGGRGFVFLGNFYPWDLYCSLISFFFFNKYKRYGFFFIIISFYIYLLYISTYHVVVFYYYKDPNLKQGFYF